MTSEEKLGQEERERKALSDLQDYVCNTAQAKDLASSNPLQKVSLDKLYLIVNYVSYANFSDVHWNFLAVITKSH